MINPEIKSKTFTIKVQPGERIDKKIVDGAEYTRKVPTYHAEYLPGGIAIGHGVVVTHDESAVDALRKLLQALDFQLEV